MACLVLPCFLCSYTQFIYIWHLCGYLGIHHFYWWRILFWFHLLVPTFLVLTNKFHFCRSGPKSPFTLGTRLSVCTPGVALFPHPECYLQLYATIYLGLCDLHFVLVCDLLLVLVMLAGWFCGAVVSSLSWVMMCFFVGFLLLWVKWQSTR